MPCTALSGLGLSWTTSQGDGLSALPWADLFDPFGVWGIVVLGVSGIVTLAVCGTAVYSKSSLAIFSTSVFLPTSWNSTTTRVSGQGWESFRTLPSPNLPC